MPTVIGNAPADAPEQMPPDGPGQAPQTPPPESRARSCNHCGHPLAPGQEWCLNCGAGAPGSLESPRWRSLTAIGAGVAVLALGAVAAAYAALNEHSPKRATIVRTVASLPPASTPPATTPIPKTTLPTSPAHTKLPGLLRKRKLPKIPLTAITPKKSSTTKSSSGSGTSSKRESESATKAAEEKSESESSEPAAILLDTNAAITYNPYGLPASYFGDPSLVIDGDTATAWTAQIDPATAPTMAEGVLLDLKALLRVSALQLDTQTPGMTVQVDGTTASKAPESILAKAWTALSPPKVIKKRETRIKLGRQQRSFRYVLLWISKAPAADVGTAQAPGHVDVNELELFPAG